jgi:L-alanine-DL-glutamate epimerase-like enolase superfamily enzyme
MKIAAVATTLHLKEPFVISRGSRSTQEVVHVTVTCDGYRGHGEAAPIERYEESVDSALAYVDEQTNSLGDDPFAIEEIMSRLPVREFAARAAVDAALHDLQGQLTGQPVWRLLGLSRLGPPTTATVSLGDPDAMARDAERASRRFRRLKLKLGGEDGLDVERVRAVRDVTALPLQVDVNEAWTLDEAIEALAQLAALGIEYCEQPLRAGDTAAAKLKAASSVPIYVDEDCRTLADVRGCVDRAHGINVKLAKTGGIREALRMTQLARDVGLELMLGCMVESGLGIAAGAQIASLFDHVDLDANLLLRHDPWPIIDLIDGVQVPSEAPGLGMHADPREIVRHV